MALFSLPVAYPLRLQVRGCYADQCGHHAITPPLWTIMNQRKRFDQKTLQRVYSFLAAGPM
jgi:hypothetical protein